MCTYSRFALDVIQSFPVLERGANRSGIVPLAGEAGARDFQKEVEKIV